MWCSKGKIGEKMLFARRQYAQRSNEEHPWCNSPSSRNHRRNCWSYLGCFPGHCVSHMPASDIYNGWGHGSRGQENLLTLLVSSHLLYRVQVFDAKIHVCSQTVAHNQSGSCTPAEEQNSYRILERRDYYLVYREQIANLRKCPWTGHTGPETKMPFSRHEGMVTSLLEELGESHNIEV